MAIPKLAPVLPKLFMAEPDGFSPKAIQLLHSHFELVLPERPPQNLQEALRSCEVVWIRLGYTISATDFSDDTACQTIVCPATGLDHIDERACAKRGISVLSLRGRRAFLSTIRGTCEHALGLLLTSLRHTLRAHHHVVRGGWNRDLFVGREIYDSLGLVIGHGRLGAIMSMYLEAMGAQVIVVDPAPAVKIPAHRERVASLAEGIARCDFASLHVNFTQATAGLLSKEIIAHFQPHACLINTSRGGLVDETALVGALRANQLACYATDVVEHEHSASESAIQAYAKTGAENVIVTPHIGGKTGGSVARTEFYMAERLIEYQTAAA